MLARVGSQVRNHFVGYVALLFLALGGTAGYATVPGCSGPCVDSTDIINGQVMTVDIANDAVNSAKIASGSVFSVDLADSSVNTVDITIAPSPIPSSPTTR